MLSNSCYQIDCCPLDKIYARADDSPISNIDPLGLCDWPALPQGVVDYAAGFGDTLSFGLTNQIRNAMGTNRIVNKCSGSYTASHASAVAFDVIYGKFAQAEGDSEWLTTWFGSALGSTPGAVCPLSVNGLYPIIWTHFNDFIARKRVGCPSDLIVSGVRKFSGRLVLSTLLVLAS